MSTQPRSTIICPTPQIPSRRHRILQQSSIQEVFRKHLYCISIFSSPFSEFEQNLFKEAAANSIEATSRSAEDSSSEAVVAAAAGVGGKTKGGGNRRVTFEFLIISQKLSKGPNVDYFVMLRCELAAK